MALKGHHYEKLNMVFYSGEGKTNCHLSRLTLCLIEKRLTKYEQLPWNQNSEFLTFYPIETSALMVYNKSDPSVPLIHYAGVSLDKPFCIKDK
jgi:hypothetical protein